EDAKEVNDEELRLLVSDPGDLTEAQKKTRKDGLEDAREALLASGKSDVYARFDWNKAFFVLGAIFLVGVVIGSQLLVNPPEGWLPEGWTPPVQKTMTGDTVKVDYTWKEMLQTPTFWLIWGMFLLAATSGLMTIGNIGKFAANKDIGVAEIALIIGVLSIANGAGRIGWSATSDRIGRTTSLCVMYLVQGITMFLLFAMGNAVVTLAIGAALVGFCFGGNFAMFPSATADFFGTKNVGQNYGFVFTAYGVAGILGAIIAGSLVESTGSYQSTFMIMGVISLIAAGLSLITKAPHEKPGFGLKKAEGDRRTILRT
ncbi:MAG: OFA family MFS transporter, partial [Thermoplasmata archaeon]|nr:OFA family MFS transporter [Thermoplasmata archaeon]